MAPQEDSGLLKDAPSLGHLPHRAEYDQERGVSDVSRETSGLWCRLKGRHRDARSPLLLREERTRRTVGSVTLFYLHDWENI